MGFLLSFFYTLLFSFIILKSSFFDLKHQHKYKLIAVFILKISFGIGLTYLYSYYYQNRSTADIFKYFDDSAILFNVLKTNPCSYFQMLFGINNNTAHFDVYYTQMHNWYREYESNLYNDSHTIIRWNAFVRIFSFGYIHVHTVFMCFLSLVGLTAIYKTFVDYLPKKENVLFIISFLIPSVLFWGSGVLKEGILLFALGLLFYVFFKFLNREFRFIHLPIALLCIVLLFYLKFYVLITLLPSLIFLFIHKRFRLKKSGYLYLLIVLIWATIGLNIHYVLPQFDALSILKQKQQDFYGLANEMNSTSLFETPRLNESVLNLIKNSPYALFNALLRPLPQDINSPIKLVNLLENAFVICFMGFCMRYSSIKNNRSAISLALVGYSILLLTIIGLVTPVIGAIVRYKVPALPFLLIAFLFILDTEKIKQTKYFRFLIR